MLGWQWKLSDGQFVVGGFENYPTCAKVFETLMWSPGVTLHH